MTRSGLWRKAFGLLCVAPSNVRVPCFSVGFRIPPLKSTPSSGNKSTRRFRMDLAAAPQAELLLLARFAGDDDSVRNRLQVILSEMAAKYQGRVATQLHGDADEEGKSQPRPDDGGPSSPSDGASFRFMRDGLAIDEYRPRGNTAYEQELHKRVVAALSLSQPRDTTTLSNLWSPAGAAGAYQDEMAVATYAVQVASTVARELQGELCHKGAISKMDSSPVTVADFSVQAIVLGILECYFPGHGFIAEETSSVLREDQSALEAVLDVVGKALCRDLTEGELCAAIDLGARGYGAQWQGGGSGGRTWVLDPIDGTKGFLRGEQFCVALGLLDGGKAVAGLLGCPNLTVDDQPAVGDSKETEASRIGHESRDRPDRGLIYTAALGGGSFVRALSSGTEQARRVEVNRARQASETRMLESVESGHSSHGVAAQVSRDLGIDLPSIRVDGQCKYGLLSQGQGGIYLRLPRWGYVENIWDHVAGAVVIQEAGGKVTDSRGEPLDFSLGAKLPREVVGIVATNGNIHGEVIRAVHRRHVEDWSRVVSEAKLEAGEAVPQLPGIEWAARSSSEKLADDEWWAAACTERKPLAMKTSEHFHRALERGWDKLVVVLFHVSGTSESQHAVGILEKLVDWHLCDEYSPNDHETPVKPPQFTAQRITASTGSATERTLLHQASTQNSEKFLVVIAEADVSKLKEVSGRRVLGKLPSMHVYLGGREIARIPVEGTDTAELLREKISAILSGEVHHRSNHVGG